MKTKKNFCVFKQTEVDEEEKIILSSPPSILDLDRQTHAHTTTELIKPMP